MSDLVCVECKGWVIMVILNWLVFCNVVNGLIVVVLCVVFE